MTIGFASSLLDDSRVVRDYVVDAVARYAVGLLPGFLHRGRVARPAWRNGCVARFPEPVDPRAPRVGVQPKP